MKITIYLQLVVAVFLSTVSRAQKVDLDRFYFDVNYQRLPKENIPYEQRTYGVHVVTGGPVTNYMSEEAIYDKIIIPGWKKIENGTPTVGIDFTLQDFVFRGSTQKSERVDEKDKNGNIISSTTYYWVEAIYSAVGFARIKGPESKKQENTKLEESKPVNKFLVNAVLNKTPTDLPNENEIRFSRDMVYNSEKRSTNNVSTEFNNNKDAIYSMKLRQFVDGSIEQVLNATGNKYGFVGVKTRDILWILDARNEEGKTQIEAIEAVKEIFKGMKADEPINILEANLQPLIEYFESLKTKYPSDEKSHRKMRYSAYYNLAKIYYYLDQPDKVIKEAEALIANDYDPKDGKRLLEEAISLKNLFSNSGFNTRHNIPFN